MGKAKKLSFLLVYGLLILPIIGLKLGGWYNFLPVMVIFFFIPVIDYFIHDPYNPNEQQTADLLHDKFYRMITMLYVPVQVILLIWAMYIVSLSTLSGVEWVGFCLSIGVITGGLGITIAHEMMHKNSKLQHLLSKVLLTTVCYGHFFIEHIRGHHVHVATPKDPATARLGESFYQFYPRTVIGSFKSAWKIELKRLARNGRSVMSIKNQFWWIIGGPLVLLFLIYDAFGVGASVFFIAQSIIAFSLLEVVNYVEHYGLVREKNEKGQYVKVSPKHSWNSNHWLTNSLLFHLQRHSDHHTYPGRPYQILRHLEQSPQLPSGYAGMVCIALVPPLWFRLMDKRVPKAASQ